MSILSVFGYYNELYSHMHNGIQHINGQHAQCTGVREMEAWRGRGEGGARGEERRGRGEGGREM